MGTGELLDFERAWPRHCHAKENAIRDRGLTPARLIEISLDELRLAGT